MIAGGVSRWIFLSARCLCLVCWWVNLFRNKASIQVHYCTIDFRSRRWAGTPYWIFMNTLCLRPHGRSTGTKEIILKGISAKFAKDKEWEKYWPYQQVYDDRNDNLNTSIAGQLHKLCLQCMLVSLLGFLSRQPLWTRNHACFCWRTTWLCWSIRIPWLCWSMLGLFRVDSIKRKHLISKFVDNL